MGADGIGFPLVLFNTCNSTSPSAEISQVVEIVELVVELEVPLPRKMSVDEPRPVRNDTTMTTTTIRAMTSFLMPQRVASWGVKFYS
jgi:hypothetical protein